MDNGIAGMEYSYRSLAIKRPCSFSNAMRIYSNAYNIIVTIDSNRRAYSIKSAWSHLQL